MSERRYTWEEIARDSKLWVSWLWNSMWRAGKGYARNSLRRTGKGEDRRPDKLGSVAPKWRRYLQRYATAPCKQTRHQLSRAHAAIMRGKR